MRSSQDPKIHGTPNVPTTLFKLGFLVPFLLRMRCLGRQRPRPWRAGDLSESACRPVDGYATCIVDGDDDLRLSSQIAHTVGRGLPHLRGLGWDLTSEPGKQQGLGAWMTGWCLLCQKEHNN